MRKILLMLTVTFAWPASADDASIVQDMALASKFAGVCGVMQQMATFQKSTQMPGGDKFIERFWKTEFARLGKSQETFFRECEGAIAIYDKIMATQNPPKQ